MCIRDRSIDEVEMAAVVGVPDDLRGQIVKAVIVPKNKFYINNQNLELILKR